MTSLARRLLLGTTLAVVGVGTVASWSLYALVERSLIGEVDRALEARARLLASTVELEGQSLDLEFTELDMTEFASAERGGFLQVWGTAGETLYRSPSLGEDELTPPGVEPGPGRAWAELPGGERGRAVSLRFQPRVERPGPVETDRLALTVARDARAVRGTLATLKGLLAVVGLVTLGVTGVVLVGVVRSSLRPVESLAWRIATIGEADLATHLDEAGVPDELLPVVQRVNGLLARLRAAFARERAFSSDVSHELRVPLAALRTILDVAASRPRDELEHAEALRASAEVVDQMQSMVERLLQLARLDARRPQVTPERADLSALAVDAWEPFASRARARGLRVDLELGDGLDVRADRELLDIVLRNLFQNAVEHADEGGRVDLAARQNGSDAVVLEVTNTGSRLSQEDADAATQRFWRGDEARTEAGVRCGLGLALVEKATRALGGRLELQSHVGGDFVARVALPADAR